MLAAGVAEVGLLTVVLVVEVVFRTQILHLVLRLLVLQLLVLQLPPVLRSSSSSSKSITSITSSSRSISSRNSSSSNTSSSTTPMSLADWPVLCGTMGRDCVEEKRGLNGAFGLACTMGRQVRPWGSSLRPSAASAGAFRRRLPPWSHLAR